MPDKYGFDHLPWWGSISHRCIWCGWPGSDKIVSEADRQRHWRKHDREQKKTLQAKREANLAQARRAKRLKERENKKAYRQEGDE